MSIGSLTFWNLGERIRSRDFPYLLHYVSLGEKHDVLQSLWQQHTEEMMLLESSVFTVCGRKCTIEFQPSAYMRWQSWACNEVNQAATYPSPYANVHKATAFFCWITDFPTLYFQKTKKNICCNQISCVVFFSSVHILESI